jgi:cardiolipin synthase A/B
MKKLSARWKRSLQVALATLLLIVIFANFRSPYVEQHYRIVSPAKVSDPRFPRTVGDMLDPAFEGGNKVETLLNGDEIFPSMLESIHSAQKTITFESYIYWSGETGQKFADALSERAKAGVRVHLLLDWAGSGKIDDKLLEEMKTGGVEVERYHEPRWYNITRMNNRTHRKVLVIDGKVGFTGGVGIADEWTGNGLDSKHWRDTHYRVEGPVVNQMQSAFMDNWLKLRPEVYLGDDYFPKLAPAGPALAQMFISSAGEGGSNVRILYLAAIAAAERTIDLQSAYFVPDQHTIDQLIAARKRGVKIRIMVPGPYNDSAVVDFASRDLWGELLQAGVEFYEYQPALFHCKVLIVDELFTSVGSTNFDERSFKLNDEANLNVIDRDFAARQLKDFERDLKVTHPMTYEQWQNRPITEKVWSKLLTAFSSQL